MIAPISLNELLCSSFFDKRICIRWVEHFIYLHLDTKAVQVDEIEQEIQAMRSRKSVGSAGLVFGDRRLVAC